MSGGNTTFDFYFQSNTHANRPATPNPAPNTLVVYFETDTGFLFVWNSVGAAWVQM